MMATRGRNDGRHAKQCTLCNHPDCDEIEAQWKAGRSSESLGDAFGLSKNVVQRHTKYYGMRRDVEDCFWRVVEAGIDGINSKAPTAAHVNEALKSIAKLQGLWVDRTEMMPTGWKDKSENEIAFYAAHGRFPREGEVETLQ